jgi:hypothetical protein
MPNLANAQVWTTTNVWNEDWENKFSHWVENDLQLTLHTVGPYAGVEADCTDTAYLIRLVFAFENKLPFKIHDSSGGFLSNENTQFNSIANELTRVKKFMKLVVDGTDSSGVQYNTYPIAINRTWLRPGVVEVQRPYPGQGGSGHAQMVKTVKDNGVIGYIWNSVPPAARLLALTFTITYVPHSDTLQAGFRRWIWPQDLGKNPETLSGYSLEQYSMGRLTAEELPPVDPALPPAPPQYNLQKYTNAVVGRLKLREITREEIFDQAKQTICSMINLRNEIVNRAMDHKAKTGGRCMNAQEYDDFSTPSRDSRLTTSFLEFFWQFAAKDQAGAFRAPEVAQAINLACPLNSFDSRHNITTFDFLSFLSNGIATSDPNDSYWRRWGYDDKAGISHCPVY